MEEAKSPRRDIIEDAIAMLLDVRDLLAMEARTDDDRARNREAMRQRRRLALTSRAQEDTKNIA